MTAKLGAKLHLTVNLLGQELAPSIVEPMIQLTALPLMKERGLEGEWQLEVRFVDNEAMRELNRQAQGYDEPTDVLSFPIHFATDEADPHTVLPPGTPQLLGSLVIAPDVAAKQAAEHSHATEHELATLIDHGLHHLLGEDHDDADHWLPRSHHTKFSPRKTAVCDI